MQEFFWFEFFLGGFVYFLIDRLTQYQKKIKFVNDIKILSFKLIGYAFQQWVFLTTAKYLFLEHSPDMDKERVKVLKNEDEAELLKWKRETIDGLINSVPPSYRGALEVKTWQDVMNQLEMHYKKVLDLDFKGNDLEMEEVSDDKQKKNK